MQINFDFRIIVIVGIFAAADLFIRYFVHRDIDSMAADVIIFAFITFWYGIIDEALASPEEYSPSMISIIKLGFLVVTIIGFSIPTGKEV